MLPSRGASGRAAAAVVEDHSWCAPSRGSCCSAAAWAINSTLLTLGMIDAPLALVNNVTGTVIGMTHVMTRFVVLPLTAALQAVDPLLCRATQSLGANRWRAFGRGIPPIAEWRGLGRDVGVRDVARLLRHAKFPRRRQPEYVVQPDPDQYRDLPRLGRTSEGASVTVVS